MDDYAENVTQQETAFAVLRKFARRRTSAHRCELCSKDLDSVHEHLLERSTRQIVCSCEPCAILFSGHESVRFLRIPRRSRMLMDFQMTDLEWESLMLPINLAFFYQDSAAGKVLAMYPSPAGATESLLSLESWTEIVSKNPKLQRMEPDVEALLVNRMGAAKEYFLVPIDECYRLVGLIRTHWRGLSGGNEVWKQMREFFSQLKVKCGHPEAASA